MTIPQDRQVIAELITALTGVSSRHLLVSLSDDQIAGMKDYIQSFIEPEKLYKDADLDAYAQGGDPDASFTMEQLKTWADANKVPTDLFELATIKSWIDANITDIEMVISKSTVKTWADAEEGLDPTDIISAATLNAAGWTHT